MAALLRPVRVSARLAVSGRRIGLLGGSFNPAHAGHVRISLLALSRLGLDELWWLVSPHNPLKAYDDLADFSVRFAEARHWARHRRLHVSDLEYRSGSSFTADTLAMMRQHYPHARFVWIMGADNLVQIPRWRGWNRIFESVPVAVFDRPSYFLPALFGQAATRYRRWRLPARKAGILATIKPPAWVFLHDWLHPASASSIRADWANDGKGWQNG